MILRLLLIAWIGALSVGWAGEVKIMKVLPHLLDAQGRHALSPSLFERDAYQLHLREYPEKISALRFDVQMKGLPKNRPLRLRLELRGSKMGMGAVRTFETDVMRTGWFSPWGKIQLDKQISAEIGSVVAWRVTLWDESLVIAEQESFLW